MISSFNELLQAASQQDDAQRLLLLFANAESSSKKHKSTQRGTIAPVMCVDKLPQEIASFEALTEEADAISKDWNFVFIAGLSGKGDVAPTTEEADPYLNKMTNDLASGQDMSQYVVFDRSGSAIALQAG